MLKGVCTMKIQLKESTDMDAYTEITCYTEDQTELAKETFLGIGLLNEPLLLRDCVKIALEHKGIIFGNDLDTVAKRLGSNAELVMDDTYRIMDMYFKRIPNSGVCGGLYRQLRGKEI